MLTLQVAQIIPDTEAEGPGRRFAIWVQGCPLRCQGCCNPQMLKFAGGSPRDVQELAQSVLRDPHVEGVTLLGGEPTAQADAAAELFQRVRQGGKSTMVFSGYTLAELRAQASPAIEALIAAADLLVDGRYERALPETRRRWIGSSNQVMHFLTDRYSPDEPQFTAPNTAEIRIRPGSILINGWPALGRELRGKAS